MKFITEKINSFFPFETSSWKLYTVWKAFTSVAIGHISHPWSVLFHVYKLTKVFWFLLLVNCCEKCLLAEWILRLISLIYLLSFVISPPKYCLGNFGNFAIDSLTSNNHLFISILFMIYFFHFKPIRNHVTKTTSHWSFSKILQFFGMTIFLFPDHLVAVVFLESSWSCLSQFRSHFY